jgi:hypothetical protein
MAEALLTPERTLAKTVKPVQRWQATDAACQPQSDSVHELYQQRNYQQRLWL